MAKIAEHGRGFVYLISRLGVTGVRDELPPELGETVERLRGVTTLPICVGFGISRPEQASAVAAMADGVVVGSAIVRASAAGADEALRLTRALRAAVDAATGQRS
jgi:tryptophan synthase alpha chain